jgi:hypothetical protein
LDFKVQRYNSNVNYWIVNYCKNETIVFPYDMHRKKTLETLLVFKVSLLHLQKHQKLYRCLKFPACLLHHKKQRTITTKNNNHGK